MKFRNCRSWILAAGIFLGTTFLGSSQALAVDGTIRLDQPASWVPFLADAFAEQQTVVAEENHGDITITGDGYLYDTMGENRQFYVDIPIHFADETRNVNGRWTGVMDLSQNYEINLRVTLDDNTGFKAAKESWSRLEEYTGENTKKYFLKKEDLDNCLTSGTVPSDLEQPASVTAHFAPTIAEVLQIIKDTAAENGTQMRYEGGTLYNCSGMAPNYEERYFVELLLSAWVEGYEDRAVSTVVYDELTLEAPNLVSHMASLSDEAEMAVYQAAKDAALKNGYIEEALTVKVMQPYMDAVGTRETEIQTEAETETETETEKSTQAVSDQQYNPKSSSKSKKSSSGSSSRSYSYRSYNYGKKSSGSGKKSSGSSSLRSYDDGYDDVYDNDDYDWDRYYRDSDYADGVDDAMDELDW